MSLEPFSNCFFATFSLCTLFKLKYLLKNDTTRDEAAINWVEELDQDRLFEVKNNFDKIALAIGVTDKKQKDAVFAALNAAIINKKYIPDQEKKDNVYGDVNKMQHFFLKSAVRSEFYMTWCCKQPLVN